MAPTEMISSILAGWYEKLEREAFREKGRRRFYEQHYSDLMTYDRFRFISNLEQEIMFGYMSDDRAIDLIQKYDEYHPKYINDELDNN